jgi:pimeloyl-ACP methyl ester carboxylesterase
MFISSMSLCPFRTIGRSAQFNGQAPFPAIPQPILSQQKLRPCRTASCLTGFTPRAENNDASSSLSTASTRASIQQFSASPNWRMTPVPTRHPSWPSRGRLFDYRLDLDNATYSRSDLAHLIRIASISTSVAEITILAHSMGSWVAVEALRQLALEDGGTSPKVKNLVLASLDLEIEVLRKQIEDMGLHRPKVTLFVSRNDRALQLSGLVSASAMAWALSIRHARLISSNCMTCRELRSSTSAPCVQAIHNVYATSPDVVRLIGDRLIQGQIVTDWDVSSPAAATDTVGSAVGLAVAAPIILLF